MINEFLNNRMHKIIWRCFWHTRLYYRAYFNNWNSLCWWHFVIPNFLYNIKQLTCDNSTFLVTI